MSEYTFRIWFSGLVHFVQNKDPNAKCQLCVVLPRGDNDTTYRTHIGQISKADREIRCGQLRIKKGDKIIDLKRRRVSFEIEHFDDVPPQNGLQHFSSFGILSMRDIAGIFADENDQIVSYDPPEDTVLAQILIGRGYNLSYDHSVSIRREWRIPETLTGYPDFKIELVDPVYVDIPRVRSVKMHYMPLSEKKNDETDSEECKKPTSPEPSSPVELRPGSNDMIEIFVSNRCEGDKCLLAKDFECRREANRLILMQLDRDFELNYRMLHPATLDALKKVLSQGKSGDANKVRFPVPESPFLEIGFAPHLCFDFPEKEKAHLNSALSAIGSSLDSFDLQKFLDFIATGTGTGSGSDCMGGRGEARFNTLDDYVPDPEVPPNRTLVQMKHQEMRAKSSQVKTSELGIEQGGNSVQVARKEES